MLWILMGVLVMDVGLVCEVSFWFVIDLVVVRFWMLKVRLFIEVVLLVVMVMVLLLVVVLVGD